MKKRILFPVFALLGGIGAFELRLLQLRTGFEANTGLAIPGNLYGRLLPVLLVFLAVCFFFGARMLPAETDDKPLSFPDYFNCNGAGIPTLLVIGIFLWLLSGGYEIYVGLLLAPSILKIVLGVLTVLTAAALFPIVAVCRRQRKRVKFDCSGSFSGNLLLAPVGYLVIRLIITYRICSVNPSLATYYVELLMLSFLILTFYRAASFAFHCGRTRRFVVYASLSVVLCIATLCEGYDLATQLLYAGGALLSIGLLLLRLSSLENSPTPKATPPAQEN